MTTFNIGTQNAASIQNVVGDSVIEGGLHASASWETVELRAAIGQVQEKALGLALPAAVRSVVDQALSAASSEAARPRPDKHRVAELLGTAARGLREAGAFTSAGTSLAEALRRAGAVLGPIGSAALGVV